MKENNSRNNLFSGVEVLTSSNWNSVNKNYIAKSISELMHEVLLEPAVLEEKEGRTQFRLDTDDKNISYYFEASHRAMDYWHVYVDTLYKKVGGEVQEANDTLVFYRELVNTLEVEAFTFARFLEETYKTLYADAYIKEKNNVPVKELVNAGSQIIEHHMKGHPWATVNKGRLGFNVEDHRNYSPEADRSVQLCWVAAHKSRATFQCTELFTLESLLDQELGEETVSSFRKELVKRNVEVEDYFFIPIHDWQWKNKIVFYFADDIAKQLLIPLGEGKDLYSPQQSIRTFYNETHPEKLYVKTAISILNTSVYRGLSPKKLKQAPFITNWIQNKLYNDEYLKSQDCVFLGEIASVAYDHPTFGEIENAPYQFKDMLGVVWRESAAPHLKEGEKMMTMASLMHVDEQGNSFIGEVVKQSGLTMEAWMGEYLEKYLNPILHCFYHHGLCFSPHGENTILVMKDHVPQRIIIKDFVEEIHLNQEKYNAAPAEIRQIVKEVPDEYVSLFILSGVFDGVFRYISNVAMTYEGYPEELFWNQVKSVILTYQGQFPNLKKEFDQFDLFTSEFIRVGFNRVRLHTSGYKDDTDIPELNACGTHVNPLIMFEDQYV